jgi:anti-anti-sigma factor
MNIRIEPGVIEGVPILRIFGNLDFDTSGRLLMAADEAWNDANPLLILDLQGVEHLDSAGVTELVLIKKRARRKDGNVVLTHVSEVACYVLNMMGLQEPLEVYDNPAAALAAQSSLVTQS